MYLSKHAEVFEREIQSHELIKSTSVSVAVLQLQICLTQSPAIIFINYNFIF